MNQCSQDAEFALAFAFEHVFVALLLTQRAFVSGKKRKARPRAQFFYLTFAPDGVVLHLEVNCWRGDA